MKTKAEFSAEEIVAIEMMGGWNAVRDRTDGILREYGITKSLLGPGPAPWEPIELHFEFDSRKSIQGNLQVLFDQAEGLQRNPRRSKYFGTVLRHLVGAKLELLLGQGVIKHHGSSVAAHSTARKSDFDVDGVAIHVTDHPREAMIRKAAANLKSGLKPIIITTTDGVKFAFLTLKGTEWADRIDVLEVGQFLTANIYERSLFRVSDCKVTLRKIIERYNVIVEQCETDPVLRIRV